MPRECGRSPTSSTSRTTSCSRWAIHYTHSTTRSSPAARSSCGVRGRVRSCARSTAIERELEPYDLMIADGERCVALAGIMGGEETEIGEDTTEILLEAANFEPYTIFRTSERLRFRTEGSNRWEKGVDPYLAEQAAKLATQLIVELAGAEWAGHADVHAQLPVPPDGSLPSRASRRRRSASRRLQISSMRSCDASGSVSTARTSPSRPGAPATSLARSTSSRRLRASDSTTVPARLPTRQAMFGRLSKHQRIRRRIEDVLVGFGYSEAYTWSLLPEGSATGGVALQEPLSSEQAVLRTSLIEGLLASALAKRPRGQRGDRALRASARLPAERTNGFPRSAGMSAASPREASPFVKGTVEGLYAALGMEPSFRRGGRSACARPGRAHRRGLGRCRCVTPSCQGSGARSSSTSTSSPNACPDLVVYEDVITYPPVRQDLAFVVPEDVTAGELVARRTGRCRRGAP